MALYFAKLLSSGVATLADTQKLSAPLGDLAPKFLAKVFCIIRDEKGSKELERIWEGEKNRARQEKDKQEEDRRRKTEKEKQLKAKKIGNVKKENDKKEKSAEEKAIEEEVNRAKTIVDLASFWPSVKDAGKADSLARSKEVFELWVKENQFFFLREDIGNEFVKFY